MKLRSNKLKALAKERGIDVEQLAGAVERTGLEGDRAASAVRNWMIGRDHPRCKSKDIERLAAAVGVPTTDIATFVSQVRNHRGSPQKAKLVTDLITGQHIDEARNRLRFSTKRAAVNVLKCLEAAAADAEAAGANYESLYVTESRVDQGVPLKRFRPKDRGRAHAILKQSSHITVGLSERASSRR